MADSDTGEKTEEPTAAKLRKLRQDGNVSKSQDVNTAISFLVTFCVLAGTLPFVGDELIGLFKAAVMVASSKDTGEDMIHNLLLEGLIVMGKACAPVMAAAFVIGMTMNIAQVGFMFTTKPITPDIKKLNPVQGIKNLINMKKLVELLKTIVKFILIAWLSYAALKQALRDVILVIRSDLQAGMSILGSIIWDFCIDIGGVFVVIAVADAFYQKKKYLKDNMMSKYDVKQEYKQSEGDPQQKAERKQLHREMLNNAPKGAVKNADVVVRNPDHIAVALKYDDEDEAAPTIVAKGMNVWAQQILDEARHYGVPIVRNIPLARALNEMDVGEEIPEELYDAVAEVLNFVYGLAEEQKAK